MPKISIEDAPRSSGSRYPAPFDRPCLDKSRRHLGRAGGLTQLGINLLELAAGAWSSQRHWHSRTDEFVYVLQGEVVLVTDGGEDTLRSGDCAAFRAGDADGHHLQNRSDAPALVLEIGAADPGNDETAYPGIDMRSSRNGYVRRDGTPYPRKSPRGD